MGLYVRKADNLIGPAPPPDAGRPGLGARYPAKPCTSIPGAPSPGEFSANRRRGLGARLPAKPCTSVPGAPSPGEFSIDRRPGLGAQ